jgi:hypothetical protein
MPDTASASQEHVQMVAERKPIKANGRATQGRFRSSDRRYRRRCACCSKFLPKDRKSSYCSPCNAERRRRDRVELRSEQRLRADFKRAHGKWGANTLEVMRFLISACGRD